MDPEYDLTYTEEDAPLLRKVIAQRMTESKLNAPHFYLIVDVDMEKMIALRTALNADGSRKFSYNDLLIRAIAITLRNHPDCNVSYIDDKIRRYDKINVCLAIAIEGGLLTPAIRECDKKSLAQINDVTQEFIEKARSRKLRPRESMGGTFTLSNLGMYGIEEFCAIINPPQALILAVGTIRDVPVVRDGRIVPGKMMKMSLSCDHKAVDGATAAAFLSDLVALIREPDGLA
jgi:pyruvate dehydrogenase E2 component (dihydrolipoamide acetyltransferase)